jgi:hypothetical protein
MVSGVEPVRPNLHDTWHRGYPTGLTTGRLIPDRQGGQFDFADFFIFGFGASVW